MKNLELKNVGVQGLDTTKLKSVDGGTTLGKLIGWFASAAEWYGEAADRHRDLGGGVEAK